MSSRCASVAAAILAVLLPASVGAWPENVSIRDVPLTPWTGFARHWDWIGDCGLRNAD